MEPVYNISKEYEDIINMTPEEAADVLGRMMLHFSGRGNGKTIAQLRVTKALTMAINDLQSKDKKEQPTMVYVEGFGLLPREDCINITTVDDINAGIASVYMKGFNKED